jgi:hypothetical protein
MSGESDAGARGARMVVAAEFDARKAKAPA